MLSILLKLFSLAYQSLYTASLFVVISILLNILLLLRAKKRNFKKLKHEFGYATPPITNPFFGHMDEFNKRDNEFKWHRELGKVFGVYNCDFPTIKVSDVNLINEVFLKQSKLFHSRVWHEHRVNAISGSILFNKGEDWRKIRRILMPALAEYRVKSSDINIHDIRCGLDKIINLFKDLTASSRMSEPGGFGSLDAKQYTKRGFMAVECSDSQTGLALEINAYDVMQVITLDVIFRLAFNLDSVDVTKGSDDENLKIVRSIMGCVDSFVLKISSAIPISRILTVPFAKYVLLSYYRKFVKILVKLNSQKKNKEESREENDGQPRRIHHILWDEYRAGNLTKSEVRTNSMAVLVAGFETTATTSSYVLWCIAKHVDCKEKLRSDLLSYGVESKYLEMFIKEVMRMYPALPNFVIRTPHVDTKLAGYTFKKGMSVYMSVNSVHYDETIWTNPHQFDPERFADGKTYPPGAYAPFGLGHRRCAGYQLAMREMKTIVCELLTNFDIQLIAPNEMTIQCSAIFLTRPSNEIRLRLIPNNVRAKLPFKVEPEEERLTSMETEVLEQAELSSNSSGNNRAHHYHQQSQRPTMNGSSQQISNGFEIGVEVERDEYQNKVLVSEKHLVARETTATTATPKTMVPMRRKATIIDIAQSAIEEDEEHEIGDDIFAMDADRDDIGCKQSSGCMDFGGGGGCKEEGAK